MVMRRLTRLRPTVQQLLPESDSFPPRVVRNARFDNYRHSAEVRVQVCNSEYDNTVEASQENGKAIFVSKRIIW